MTLLPSGGAKTHNQTNDSVTNKQLNDRGFVRAALMAEKLYWIISFRQIHRLLSSLLAGNIWDIVSTQLNKVYNKGPVVLPFFEVSNLINFIFNPGYEETSPTAGHFIRPSSHLPAQLKHAEDERRTDISTSMAAECVSSRLLASPVLPQAFSHIIRSSRCNLHRSNLSSSFMCVHVGSRPHASINLHKSARLSYIFHRICPCQLDHTPYTKPE